MARADESDLSDWRAYGDGQHYGYGIKGGYLKTTLTKIDLLPFSGFVAGDCTGICLRPGCHSLSTYAGLSLEL